MENQSSAAAHGRWKSALNKVKAVNAVKNLLMIIEVKHSSGKTDKIKIHEGDDPATLATEFVDEHALPPHYVDVLTQNISRSIEEHEVHKKVQQEEEEQRIQAAEGRRREEETDNRSTEDADVNASMDAGADVNRERHDELIGRMTKFKQKLMKQKAGGDEDGEEKAPVEASPVTRPPPPPPAPPQPPQEPAYDEGDEEAEKEQENEEPAPPSHIAAPAPPPPEDYAPAGSDEEDEEYYDEDDDDDDDDDDDGEDGYRQMINRQSTSSAVVGDMYQSDDMGKEAKLRNALFSAPPPTGPYHVVHPISRGAGHTRITSAEDRDPGSRVSAQENEDMFNRSRQNAVMRGKAGAGKGFAFQTVQPSPSAAPSSRRKVSGSASRIPGKSTKKNKREMRRAQTFERLHGDHFKRNSAVESMRKKKEDQELKYVNTHGFKSLKRSSDMVGQRTSKTVHNSVGERLHHDGISKVKATQDKIEKRKQVVESERDLWNCPKCHFTNKGSAESCQFVVGRTVPLDEIRPSCWTLVDHSDPTKIRTPDPESQLIMCAFPRPAEKFMPSNVSAQSRKLIREWQRSETVWETLHQNVAAEEKRKQLVRNTIEDEDVELTLQPQIPIRSRALVQESLNMQEDADGSEPRQPADRNIELYEEHAKILEQSDARMQIDYTEQCTFEPDIGRSKLRAKPDATQKDFVQRLHKERQEFDDRTDILRKHYNTEYDPSTGIEYFQPQTGRGPMQREMRTSIHEVLYRGAPDKENALAEAKAKQDDAIKARSSVVHRAPKSDKMLKQISRRVYSDVYRALLLSVQYKNNPDEAPRSEMLDEDMWRTASLDTQVADPTMLAKPKMQKVVGGVLQKWKARLMSYDMFCKLMDTALAEDTEPIGDMVAPTYKTDFEAISMRDLEGCTFEPEMNEKSRIIGQNIRGRNGVRPIHDVLHAEKSRYLEGRLNAIQKANQKVFEECTFQPKFMSKQSSDSSGNSIYPLTRQYYREHENKADRDVDVSQPSRRVLNFEDEPDIYKTVHGDRSAPGAANPDSPHRWHATLRSPSKEGGLNDTFSTTGTRSPRKDREKAFFQGAGEAAADAAKPAVQPHQRSLVELAEDLVRGGHR